MSLYVLGGFGLGVIAILFILVRRADRKAREEWEQAVKRLDQARREKILRQLDPDGRGQKGA